MQCKKVSIRLGKHDQILIRWLNLLRENEQQPATWIQAAILADAIGKKIDLGSVKPQTRPLQKFNPVQSNHLMFGDDTETGNSAKKNSWGVRGVNGEFISGSLLVIHITRPYVIEAVAQVEDEGFKVSTYIKAVTRKCIRVADEESLPLTETVLDVIELEAPKALGKRNKAYEKAKEYKKQSKTQNNKGQTTAVISEKVRAPETVHPLLSMIS